jgi:hypothetical protein
MSLGQKNKLSYYLIAILSRLSRNVPDCRLLDIPRGFAETLDIRLLATLRFDLVLVKL